MIDYKELNIIKVHQNIGSFFLTKITPKILHKISNKKLSRIEDGIKGIQREIKDSKVKGIKEYLESKDATFPNTIIISIQNNPLDEYPAYILDDDNLVLKIKIQDGIANILDGQHRVSGFDSEEDNFELPVSIFLDLSLGEQAKIFAKINSTQTKVDSTLVYDLFGITEERTVEKVAYHLVEHLNTEHDSVWKGKIKTLSDKSGDLAQGSMAKFFHKELLEKELVFKKLYNDERDTDIKNILINYFNAVENIFPKEWENEDKKFILTKTTGFNGLMSFFVLLVRLADIKKVPLSMDYFKSYFEKVSDSFIELTSENYPSGAVGQSRIATVLKTSLSNDEKVLLKLK